MHFQTELIFGQTGKKPKKWKAYAYQQFLLKNNLDDSFESEKIFENEIKELIKLIKDRIECSKLKEKVHELGIKSRHKNKKIESLLKKQGLYLIKNERTGFYKIGISMRILDRFKTLQAEDPLLKLSAMWENLGSWEKYWHEYFSDFRLKGEWFSLNKVQVAFLCLTMNKIKNESNQ